MLVYIAANTARTVYLLVYNGVQWAGFILIVMSLLKCLPKGRGRKTHHFVLVVHWVTSFFISRPVCDVWLFAAKGVVVHHVYSEKPKCEATVSTRTHACMVK